MSQDWERRIRWSERKRGLSTFITQDLSIYCIDLNLVFVDSFRLHEGVWNRSYGPLHLGDMEIHLKSRMRYKSSMSPPECKIEFVIHARILLRGQEMPKFLAKAGQMFRKYLRIQPTKNQP